MRLFGIELTGGSRPKRFKGTIDERLTGLFDCGVSFAGKSILDAGCNVGLVAYEIAKQRPSFIHGMDNYFPAVRTAQAIFRCVDVPSRFDVINLANNRSLKSRLRPTYDIVLLLSVWMHLRKYGDAAADRAVLTIAETCLETMVVRNRPGGESAFEALIHRAGFRLGSYSTERCLGSRLAVYQRA